jgi:NADH-quinone oxidoreductase subunit D
MTVFLYAYREREYAMDLMEQYCGARFTHSSIRIGGVPLDLPHDWLHNLEEFIDKLPKAIETYEGLLDQNRIWKMRLENVGILTPEAAQSWGASGIMLRGSGINWDIRKEEPYELYDEVEFDVPISSSCDCYGRYKLYMEEIRQSIRILRQLIPMYSKTSPEIMADAPKYISAPKEQLMTQNYSLMQHFALITQGMRPPVGEVYVATESSKGELGYYINSQGGPYPYRLKLRTPSFWHCSVYQEMMPGCYLPDAIAIIASSNILLGETDR